MAIDISIPRVQNCCCCGSLKCGTIGIAIVFMVVNLLSVIVTVMMAVTGMGVDAFTSVNLVLDSILIILCIVLLVGAIKGNPVLCRVWIIGALVFVTAMFILTIVVSSLFALNVPAMAHIIGFFWFFLAIEEGLLIYGVIVVNSFAESLRHQDATLPSYSHVNETAVAM